MEASLKGLLQELLSSKTTDNFALNYLLNDYAKYHFVMVIGGGLGAALLLALSINQSLLFWESKNPFQNLKTLSGKIHFYLGCLSGALGIALTLIVIGNLGNAINPRKGFEGALTMMEMPSSGSRTAQIQSSFTQWLRSGSESIPPLVRESVSDRLAWQRPKAIICLALLVLTIFLSKKVWRSLIAKSQQFNRIKTIMYFCAGVLLSLTGTLFLVMFIGNTQGSFAPMALSLFFS